MCDENWNDDRDLVIVRRVVYKAAHKLEEEARTDEHGFMDWNLAEMRRDLCRDEGDNEAAEFWHEVFDYLMTLECVSTGTLVKIIE